MGLARDTLVLKRYEVGSKRMEKIGEHKNKGDITLHVISDKTKFKKRQY